MPKVRSLSGLHYTTECYGEVYDVGPEWVEVPDAVAEKMADYVECDAPPEAEETPAAPEPEAEPAPADDPKPRKRRLGRRSIEE